MEAKREPTLEGYEIAGGFLERGGVGLPLRVAVRQPKVEDMDPPPIKRGRGKGRKTKLSLIGVSLSLIDNGGNEYANCIRSANKYRKVRMKELVKLHGHLSAGAGAMLASASLALAASRFLYQAAAADGDADTLKKASQLADSARQHELAAWELSSREGVLKRRQETAEAGMPWLLTSSGVEKVKPGRKTNLERLTRTVDSPAVVDSGRETSDAGEG